MRETVSLDRLHGFWKQRRDGFKTQNHISKHSLSLAQTPDRPRQGPLCYMTESEERELRPTNLLPYVGVRGGLAPERHLEAPGGRLFFFFCRRPGVPAP